VIVAGGSLLPLGKTQTLALPVKLSQTSLFFFWERQLKKMLILRATSSADLICYLFRTANIIKFWNQFLI